MLLIVTVSVCKKIIATPIYNIRDLYIYYMKVGFGVDTETVSFIHGIN